jgi:hypothetical protein
MRSSVAMQYSAEGSPRRALLVLSKLTGYLAPENKSRSIPYRGSRIAAGLVVILAALLFNLYVVGREDLANVTMVYLIAMATSRRLRRP